MDELPGCLTAPWCLGVVEQPDGECWIWMEDVEDEMGQKWPLEHYGVVARHLGQFNGAYLVGQPIPSHPWLSRGWLRSTVDRPAAAPGIARLRNSLERPLVRRVYPPNVVESVLRYWVGRDTVLDALSNLPRTLCHFDAYSRNLLARQGTGGGWQTVLVDWACVGVGPVGEDIVPLVAASLLFQDVEVANAAQLDRVVFQGYLQGLRETGWAGDERAARLGYTAASALRYGTAYAGHAVSILMDEPQGARWAHRIGRSMEEVLDWYPMFLPFLHRLGDEAWQLMDEL